MFGIKIMTEERYQSEQKAAQKLTEINEELIKKNVRLELDIKSLREQNTKLRSINAKRKDENDALVEKNHKLRQRVEENDGFRRIVKTIFPHVDFKGFTPVPCNHKCADCSKETADCKKYTDLSVCMVPSFRDKK